MVELPNIQNPFDKKLNTTRLELRRIRESDDRDMFEYTSNPSISKFLSWSPHTEIAQTQRYISSLLEEYSSIHSYAWALELKELNKFIGIVRIFDISFGNKRGELSYILNPSFQGKGLITEAIKSVLKFCFKEIGLNRIQAKCTSDNYASEKVIRNVGMSFEGTLKEFWINKGIRTDAKSYALTYSDYISSAEK